MASPKQHHYPAALIGSFSAAAIKRPRDRGIWVQSRGRDRPFLAAAKAVGFDAGSLRMYDEAVPWFGLEDVSWLDGAWQQIERRLPEIQGAVREAARTGQLPDQVVAFRLAPLGAQLFVRHPRFTHIMGGGLFSTAASPGLYRTDALWSYAGLLAQRRWTVLIGEAPFVTSDLGWAPLDVHTEAARLRGYLIPLTSSLALFVDARALGTQGRMPTGHPIDVWPTPPEEVRELNQALAAWAPRELYGSTESAVMDAAAGLGQAARGPWELPSQLLPPELGADELRIVRLLARSDWTAACLAAGEVVMGAGFFAPRDVSFPKGSLERWGIGLRALAPN